MQKVRLSIPSSILAGDYRIGWAYELRNDNGDKRFRAQVDLDEGTILRENMESTNQITESGDGFGDWGGFIEVTLTAAAHTVDLDFKATSDGGTVEIQRARLEIWRVS